MISTFIAAVQTVVAPLLILIIPGLAFVPRPKNFPQALPAAARVILWSISLLTLGSLFAIIIKLPLYLVAIIALLATILARRPFSRSARWYTLTVIICFLLLYAAFSVPFLLYHDGLPTGDSQKTIIWASKILQNQELATSRSGLPDYSEAKQLLNRDPVDFYTPGLHALTALVMRLAPYQLTAVGFLSIAFSLAAVLIGVAVAYEVFPKKTHISFILLVVWFILTHFRFLRYLREPGYHLQNVAGEVLLFGLLFLAITLLKKWNRRDAILAFLTAISLVLTHQFSAFLAVFLLLPAVVIFIMRRQPAITLVILGLLLLFSIGFIFNLHHKIPHIFTTAPHLLNLTPNLTDYPRALGAVWFFTGLGGLILLLLKNRKRTAATMPVAAFTLGTLILLALSQGPRLGIDIPPVRALFFSIIPLSITAAYFVFRLINYIQKITSPLTRQTSYLILIVLVIFPAGMGTAKAFTLSHTISINSTLTAGQLTLIDYLANQDTGDYNRRSASWLVLSGHPMFTRLAANLATQMDESRQSSERYNLYLKQMDFEKIFALASQPGIEELMAKHNIRWLTSIEKTSHPGFQHNPALVETTRADDIILYKTVETLDTQQAPSLSPWLLRASTLANDIGDGEDTFEHLPASLRSTRLSEPQFDGELTYRTTTAPLIPISFNIGDYVRVLWDKEKTGRPDTSLELSVRATSREDLQIITPAGTRLPLPLDGTTVKIDARDVPFDDRGFITIIIDNPGQQPVAIDLIALGLARTP